MWLQAQALKASGYVVSVVSPRPPAPEGRGGRDRTPAYSVIDGIHVYRFHPAPAVQGPIGYVWEFSSAFVQVAGLLARVQARQPIDVLQVCNPPDTMAPLGVIFKRLGAAFVYDQHDLCPELYASRFLTPRFRLMRGLLALERWTYRTADHVLSTNESYRQVALTRGHLDGRHVTVVRNGPNSEVMRRSAADAKLRRGKSHLLVYLGVMGPQDGVDGFLRILHLLRTEYGRDDFSAALLGFGDCLEELKDLSAELGLTDVVSFPGRVSLDEMAPYMSTAAVGISPDPPSPLNDVSTMNKTMEYMSFGLPVVSYDLPETRVSLGDQAGLLVEPGNEHAFAEAIISLLDDAPKRQQLGDAGRLRAVTQLDWRFAERRYLEVYAALLGRVVVPAPSAAGDLRVLPDTVVLPDAARSSGRNASQA